MRNALIAATALALLPVAPAAAATFTEFVGFGDSTIDSGWWKGALSGSCGAVAAPCTTGNAAKDSRIANAIANGGTGAPVGVGLMNSQVLAGFYGLSALPANQPGGTNYAISGALSAPVGGIGGNLNPNPNLPSTTTQIATYLTSAGGHANPHALYLISTGGNDITYAINNYSGAQRQTFLAGQLATLTAEVKLLQDAGAKYILVHGNYGQGLLATFLNQTLKSDFATAGIGFVYSDVGALVQAVTANPTAYGFTAATVGPGIAGVSTGSACVGGGSGWGQWCGDTTTPHPDFAHLRTPNSEQTSFFSDDQHFSAAGQRLEAEFDYRLLEAAISGVPETSTWAMLLLGFAGLGLVARRTRRHAADAVTSRVSQVRP